MEEAVGNLGTLSYVNHLDLKEVGRTWFRRALELVSVLWDDSHR